MSRAEAAFAADDAREAAAVLSAAPGMLWRSADRLLRTARPGDIDGLAGRFAAAAPHVSGRVLLSVREHLQNRTAATEVRGSSRTARAVPGSSRTGGRPGRGRGAGHARRCRRRDHDRRLPRPGILVIDPAHPARRAAAVRQAAPGRARRLPARLGHPGRGGRRAAVLRLLAADGRGAPTTTCRACSSTSSSTPTRSSRTRLRDDVAEHSGDITDAPARRARRSSSTCTWTGSAAATSFPRSTSSRERDSMRWPRTSSAT